VQGLEELLVAEGPQPVDEQDVRMDRSATIDITARMLITMSFLTGDFRHAIHRLRGLDAGIARQEHTVTGGQHCVRAPKRLCRPHGQGSCSGGSDGDRSRQIRG
jgi:hypothetical protein